MAIAWRDTLKQKLIKKFGKNKGSALSKKYHNAFSSFYRNAYNIQDALNDIDSIESLESTDAFRVNLCYLPHHEEHPLRIRAIQSPNPTPLSDVLPVLENFNLRTYNERLSKIKLKNEVIWISDLSVEYKGSDFSFKKAKDFFEEAITEIYRGIAENDGFNKLILGSNLSWREISILRAYAKYLHQIGFRFSQTYIENTLINHSKISKNMINLFKALHDPENPTQAKSKATALYNKIIKALDKVTSLDEDLIIRRILDLIYATMRTNYFQKGKRDYLSFKLESEKIPEMPLPSPKYEIFIYSPRFEGIHLRSSKVARGGIRWSDRLEDYRTEILGLMKAQVVKNALIVPSGAKGGFVLKHKPQEPGREALLKAGIAAYQSFISALLEITDNIKNKKTVRPKDTVCYDDEDPYLVVAADKGTATFSDIANEIAEKHQFWLDDAFASGGKTGYDHKKIGITARGAWESVKRHFRELNIDVFKDDITTIAIGDMAGDVFGNGMLYTDHIKLVAAFNHIHIFIDPDPDPKKSFKERKRLFNLSGSSWEDYNKQLISKGGGVFSRTEKAIKISPEMKKILDVNASTLTPNELIRAILKAPVDLLFNGGIGTYVKSNDENHTDVGDHSNDYNRINGDELRCRVVGEGGNLGFTQLGRVEYAMQGGLINTDFIDNAGGVNCSDHEVNLKILLNEAIRKKKLSKTKRNALLASVSDEVADLVLSDNYKQALVMSFTADRSKRYLSLHQTFIKNLEAKELLDREVEYLPTDKKLSERKANNIGLTRPEIAVLLAYSKISLKNDLMTADLLKDKMLTNIITSAFPETIQKKYSKIMKDHRLSNEIISTQLSNQIINEMGITFIYRLQTETGANIVDIAKAYTISSHIFNTRELHKAIDSHHFSVDLSAQYEIFFHIRNLINLSTRWFLRGGRLDGSIEKIVAHYSPRVKKLEDLIPSLMGGETKSYLDKLTAGFEEYGLNPEMARRVATCRAIYTSLNIIQVSTKHKTDLIKTAEIYFNAGERVGLLWFRDQISNDSREGHWNVLARLTLRDELDFAQRALTIAVLTQKNTTKQHTSSELLKKWFDSNEEALSKWDNFLSELHSSSNLNYTMFFIAVRELISFVISTEERFTIAL